MKKKIYYILANCGHLEPTSGDRINEMNTIRALCENYDVYYNNQFVDPESQIFGLPGAEVGLPNQRYDLHYVRANKELFLKLPHPKIWFVVPYVEECYRDADAVVCITQAWKDRIGGLAYDFKLQETMGIKGGLIQEAKKYILFPQVVDPLFFRERDQDKILFYRKIFRAEFVCGHMGRVVKSAYPYHLINAVYRYLPSEKIKYIFYGNKKMDLPDRFDYLGTIPRQDVPEVLSAFDITVCGANNWASVSGYLKVLEAAACGVPVIVPRYQARFDEFGRDYPLYWTFGSETHDLIQEGGLDSFLTGIDVSQRPKKKVSVFNRIIGAEKERQDSFEKLFFEKESQELAKLIQKTYHDEEFRVALKQRLISSAQKFSVSSVSKIMVGQLSSIF